MSAKTQAWLEKYRDYEIEVIYLNEHRDRGRLTDFGDGWIELGKPAHETFLIPISSVRMLKLICPPRGAPNRLLRPASAPDEIPDHSFDDTDQPTQPINKSV